MIHRRLLPMGTALVLFFLTIGFMGPLMQSLVAAFWLRPGVTETIGTLPWIPAVSRSSVVQHEALALADVLPVYGSSELRSGRPFAPGVVFTGRPTGFITFYIGGPLFQCLPHLINLAGQTGLRGKRLVFLLPTDWFFRGLGARAFAPNFSPLNVYQMLFSSDLPAPLRQVVVKRILQYPRVVKKHRVLYWFLRSYVTAGWRGESTYAALWPAARLELAALEVRDALLSIQNLNQASPRQVMRNSRGVRRLIPWDALRSRATREGRAAVRNRYGVDNAILSRVATPRARGSQRRLRMGRSTEYYDLSLLLKVLKTKGARPLFIILPFNGPFRDYTGLPAAQRRQHFRRVRQILSRYGYPYVDLSSQAYVPYYFNDPVHLSPRAWVDIDEILDDFFHNRLVLIDHVPRFINTNVPKPIGPDPHLKVESLAPQATAPPYRALYNVTDLWRTGDRPDYERHVWNPAFAFSGCYKDNPRQGVIGTYVQNNTHDKWSGTWKTPGPWGAVRITGIAGNMASFTTASGVKGTFNLATHTWLKQTEAKAV